MSSSRADYIPNAVRETLDSVVSPSVRDGILKTALASANLREVPQTPAEFAGFLAGPLQEAVYRSLGNEFGGAVTGELERIATLARQSLPSPQAALRNRRAADPARTTMRSRYESTTNEAPSSPRVVPRQVLVPLHSDPLDESQRRMPTEPAPPLPDSMEYPKGTAAALGVTGTASVTPSSQGRPVVLIASTDVELLRSFEAWLAMRALVQPAPGVIPLLQSLELAGPRRVVILADCRNPSIRPLTLAALADELRANVHVLLWGASPALHGRLRTVSPAVERWRAFEGQASADEIVAHCVKLVG